MHCSILYWRMSMILLVYLLLLIKAIDRGHVTANIIVPPVGQNVLLRTYPEFLCRADGRAPRWIINGTEFDPSPGSLHTERGIERSRLQQVTLTEYESALQVHAIEINNNTEIQCVVPGDNVTFSEPVYLKIQGLLDAPLDLTAISINITTIRVTWSVPFTLEIAGDSLAYNIVIKDTAQQEVVNVNSTLNEYFYTASNDCNQLETYAVCVAGINGIGTGLYSDPVTVILGFLQLRSFNTSIILDTSKQFTCEILCDNSLLVTWLINGSFLSHLGGQLSVTTRSDYSLQCPQDGNAQNNSYSATLEVLTGVLTPFRVQCAAVYVTVHNQGITAIMSRMCFSHSVHVEVFESVTPDPQLNITTGIIPKTNDSLLVTTLNRGDRKAQQYGTFEVAVAAGAVITAFLGSLFVIQCVIICRLTCIMKKRKGKIKHNQPMLYAAVAELPGTNNEIIYEQCGDPTPPEKKSTDPAIVYDYPSCTSFPPTMEPCIVGAMSLQPSTEPCIAYGVPSSQPSVEPCINIARAQPMESRIAIQPHVAQPIMEPCVAYEVHPET